jgi:hypothetical protein
LNLTNLEIETLTPYLESFAKSYYGQLDSIEDEQQPIIFYSTGELTLPGSSQQRYVSVQDLFQEVIEKDIKRLYQSGGLETVNKIFDYTKKIISDASTVIESCSSMFIMIEGNLPEQKSELYRKSIYNHYHPLRHGRDECLALTYIELCDYREPVKEFFSYQDFHSIDYSPPSWYGMSHHDRAKELLRCDTFPMKKFTRTLSKDAVLRIEFDACRWFHGVHSFTSNMWIMIVFNDVNFIDKHNYGPPVFKEVKI